MKKGLREPSPEQIERFEQTRKELLESPLIKNVQKIVLEHYNSLEEIKKKIAPTLEQVRLAYKQVADLHKQETEFLNIPPILYNPQNDTRRILQGIEELKISITKSNLENRHSGEVVIAYDTEDGSLSRFIDGKNFSYGLTEDGKRKKLLDLLLNRRGYVKTDELRKLLDSPSSQAIAKLAQAINDNAKKSLRIQKIKIIEGKKVSGYRINPKVTIRKE